MIKKITLRIIQFFLKIGIKLIKWESAEVIRGTHSLKEVPKILKHKGFKKIFIITDPHIYSLGLCDELIEEIETINLNCQIFNEVVSNPTIVSVEKALEIFKLSQCDAIVAIGGGSVMDTAKLLGARYANSQKSLKQMKGYFKVKKPLPYLVAIPTTSGSGSEATIVGVVTDEESQLKYAITSLKLIPKMVILDPLLTINLPPFVSATTGMDALTHALECYIGKANTKETKRLSLEAIKKIWINLEKVVKEPSNLEARTEMQEASYIAGIAFTRGFVGYVHALAHQLSGFYNTPHGLANAVILPEVLKKYDSSINKDMAILYRELGYEGKCSDDQKREFIIQEIYNLNKKIGIPRKIEKIQERDLEKMVKRCLKEAHPMYPVPKILKVEELLDIYKEII